MHLSDYEEYLDTQVERGNLSPDTRRAYAGAMRRYADWLGHGDIGDAPLQSFKDYCTAAAAGKVGKTALEGSSLNVAKCSYRKVLHNSGRAGDYDDLKFWFSEHFRVSASGSPDHFTDGELDAIREAAADDPREAALVAILSETGCRVGEVIRLDRDDVTFDAPFPEESDAAAGVRIQRQKRGEYVEDVRPLSQDAADAINRYIDAIGEYGPAEAVASSAMFVSPVLTRADSPNLPSGIAADTHDADGNPMTWRPTDSAVGKWLKAVAARCGHEDVTPERMHAHLFRHTVGTHLGEDGYSAEQIGAFLGRASGADEYVHLEDSDVVTEMASAAP